MVAEPQPDRRCSSRAFVFGAGLAVLVSRLLLAPRHFENWDVFEYALALRHFDPAASQPHVPGFPLFVLAAKPFALLCRDELLALRCVSALASALSVPLLYRLGERLASRRLAALWVLWWVTLPLCWKFGILPLGYTLEALAALWLVERWWAAWCGESLSAWALGGAFGLSGGIRPSIYFVLGPLWLVTLARTDRRTALRAVVAAVLGGLAWLVPTVARSGGWQVYHTISDSLMRALFGPGNLLGGDWRGPVENATRLVRTVVAMFGPAAVLLPVAWLTWTGSRRTRANGFVALWLGSGVLYLLAFHFGQDGYLLAFLPAFGYSLLEALRGLAQAAKLRDPRGHLVLALGAAIAFTQAGDFLTHDHLELLRTSHRWTCIVGGVREHFQPADTWLLDYPTFHEAGWYLPEFHTTIFTPLARPLTALPLERQGVFTSYRQAITPRLWWYPSAFRGEPWPVPRGVRYLVFTSGTLAAFYHGATPLRPVPGTQGQVSYLEVQPGAQVVYEFGSLRVR